MASDIYFNDQFTHGIDYILQVVYNRNGKRLRVRDIIKLFHEIFVY